MRTPQLADNLRRAVLQAAIEGKLNDRTNENARDLLAAIQTEKTALQKTGKLKKNKPLAAISEEEIPFAIPENWVWVRLGEIISLKSGQDLTPSEYSSIPEGIPYITGASHFNNGQLDITRWTTFPKNIAEKGSLLFTCKGTVGEMAFLQEEKAHIARQVMAITSFEGKVELNFIKLTLDSYVSQIKANAKSMIPGISRDDLLLLSIPLPPLTEQQQIVAKLNQLLSEIDNLKTQEQALLAAQNAFPKKLRAAILQAAIQGELNERTNENARDLLAAIQAEKAALQKTGKLKKDKPLAAINEEEIPFAIPENWVLVRLGDVILQNIGGGTPSKQEPSYWNGEIPWASVKDLNCDVLTKTIDSITAEGLENSSANLIPKGTFIICTRMGLGKIALAEIDVAINQDLRAVFLSKSINKKYFYHFYRTLKMEGKGATVKGITVEELHNIPIPLPPLTEQQQIVAKLEALLAEIDTLENAA